MQQLVYFYGQKGHRPIAMITAYAGHTVDHVPPVSDPSWQLLTAPLLRYCRQHPHTIHEIVDWGRCQSHSGSMIRHMLAWLSFNEKVYYAVSAKTWRVGPEPAWVASPADDTEPLLEVESCEGF